MREIRAVLENWTPQPSFADPYLNDQDTPEPAKASVGPRAITSSRFDDNLAIAFCLDAPGTVDSLRKEMSSQDHALAIDLAVERLGSQRHVSGAAIALQDDTAMMCIASTGSAPPVGTPLDLKAGLSAACVRACKPIYCEDTFTDSRVDAEVCAMLQIRSVFIVPIFSSMRVIGLVEVFSAQPNNFSIEQRAIIQEVAALVADSVRAQRQPAPTIEEKVEEAPAVVPEVVVEQSLPVVSAEDEIRALFVPPTEKSRQTETARNDSSVASPSARLSTPSKKVSLGLLGAVAVSLVGVMLWRAEHQHALSIQNSSANYQVAPQPAADKTAAADGGTTVTAQSDAQSINKEAPAKRPVKAASKASGGEAELPVMISEAEPLVPAKSTRNIRPAEAAYNQPVRPQTTAISLPSDVLNARQPNVTLQAPIRSGGKLIQKVMPVYPQNAKSMGLSGKVRLLATIGKQGNVESVKVLSGSPMLTSAAEQAVRQWKYEPFLINGTPTINEAQVEVAFRER